MRMRPRFRRVWAGLLALATLSTPLVITASCDRRRGTFDFRRFDDHGLGPFDFFVDDCGFFDCFFGDELILFD